MNPTGLMANVTHYLLYNKDNKLYYDLLSFLTDNSPCFNDCDKDGNLDFIRVEYMVNSPIHNPFIYKCFDLYKVKLNDPNNITKESLTKTIITLDTLGTLALEKLSK